MADSTNLLLPYMAASQSQKHVTHNEALRLLDGLVQMAVVDRDLSAPPETPEDGARYIVAAGGSGAWAGWDGAVAMWSDGVWYRLQPRTGWICWVGDESTALAWSGTAWVGLVSAMGLIGQAEEVEVARSASGFSTGLAVREELLAGLSGAAVASTINIPNRAILLGVSTLVETAITGATSFSCGVSGDSAQFGGSLGIAVGGTNIGVIGPSAYYADTPVILSADGGDFTGGSVLIAIHYILCKIP
jgi:hypothetical protein